MKIAGIESSCKINETGVGGTGGKVSAIEKELETKKRELSELNKRQKLSKEEQAKKWELKQQIAELEQQLKKAMTEEREEWQKDREKQKNVRVKEDGKGDNVDEII